MIKATYITKVLEFLSMAIATNSFLLMSSNLLVMGKASLCCCITPPDKLFLYKANICI